MTGCAHCSATPILARRSENPSATASSNPSPQRNGITGDEVADKLGLRW